MSPRYFSFVLDRLSLCYPEKTNQSMPAKNQYIIVREDLTIDPIRIVSEGLLIGRLRQCELLLNHPSVSRVQAGIKQVDDDYYVFALRPKNPVILNGKPVEENEALAP